MDSSAAKKNAAKKGAAKRDGTKRDAKDARKDSDTVAQLVNSRLKELEKTREDLAASVEVPIEYIEDLLSGRRRPPLPNRTDLYEPMTSFLGLSRNELATIATAERKATAPKKLSPPKPAVRRKLLELCEPKTVEQLESRASRAELADYMQRLLEITQTPVRHMLADKMTLRVAARSNARTYAAMRLEVLEFLDTTAETLSVDHFGKFVEPRVAKWSVDLDTGVLHVVMHSGAPRAMAGRGTRSGY